MMKSGDETKTPPKCPLSPPLAKASADAHALAEAFFIEPYELLHYDRGWLSEDRQDDKEGTAPTHI